VVNQMKRGMSRENGHQWNCLFHWLLKQHQVET
jgi:hypothetical protein